MFSVVVVERKVFDLFFVEVIEVFEYLFGDEFTFEGSDDAFDFCVLVRSRERNERELDSLFFTESTELVGFASRLFSEFVFFVFCFEEENELGSVVDPDLIGLTVFFEELFEKIDRVGSAFLFVRPRKQCARTIVYSCVIVDFSDSFDAKIFDIQPPQLVESFFGPIRSTLFLSLFFVTS